MGTPRVAPETPSFAPCAHGEHPDPTRIVSESLVAHGEMTYLAALRDYELSSSARDYLSAHRDRSFEDLNLFTSNTSNGLNLPFDVI